MRSFQIITTGICIVAALIAAASLWVQISSAPAFHAATIVTYMNALVDTIAEKDPSFRKRFTERLAGDGK